MLSERITFTKENVDLYLKELGKEYRKLNGKGTPAELVLIGGASVLINYGFRDMTTDIDALIHAASTMKEAINNISDRFGLPGDWLNNDFRKTSSFTFKLYEFAKYYKTFYGVLTVRVISGEYLIAMKLRAGRQYKNDISDILGILAEHEKKGDLITMDRVEKAVNDLYGGWDGFDTDARPFIENSIKSGNYKAKYHEYREQEIDTRNKLTEFERENPNVVNRANIKEIVNMLKERSKKD